MSGAEVIAGGGPADPVGEVKRNRAWLLILGICLLILGIVAVMDSVFFTVVSMFFFGWVLIVAGIVETIQAFRHRKGGHLFLHALNAVLSIVVGVILVRNPVAGAVVVTLMLAIYFTVAGIFRIVAALASRGPAWGWVLFNGIVTLVLGILVWSNWPQSGLWVIGLFIGIDLIFVGWSQIMQAFGARSLPAHA